MTLIELAKEIHFSESQLSFIENGEGRLTQRRANDNAMFLMSVQIGFYMLMKKKKKIQSIKK